MDLFTTVLAGVLVFSISQIFLKWMIEPIQELRKTISEILFHLANDHSTIHTPGAFDKQEVLSICKNFERLGARLLACEKLIPFYKYTRIFFKLPKSENIKYASKKLSLISKSTGGKEKEINYLLDLYRINTCEALGLEDPIQGGMTKKELIDGINEIRNQSKLHFSLVNKPKIT